MEGHAMPPANLGHARRRATEDDDAHELEGIRRNSPTGASL